jgi:hypothetical protein
MGPRLHKACFALLPSCVCHESVNDIVILLYRSPCPIIERQAKRLNMARLVSYVEPSKSMKGTAFYYRSNAVHYAPRLVTTCTAFLLVSAK